MDLLAYEYLSLYSEILFYSIISAKSTQIIIWNIKTIQNICSKSTMIIDTIINWMYNIFNVKCIAEMKPWKYTSGMWTTAML